jgi:O-antigen/teichoic acid export membrane protein
MMGNDLTPAATLPVAHDGPASRRTTGDMSSVSAKRIGGRWEYLRRALTAKDSLAVLDQAVVSGASFLTTVLVGRWCGAGELGVYSLGFTLLVLGTCIQESLIVLPYTIYLHRPRQETPAEFAGSALVHNGLLSALVLIILMAGSVILSISRADPEFITVAVVLAAVIPTALLREFGRRFAFAHLRMAEALLLDLAVAAAQLAGLTWLASVGALSAPTAFCAVGVACAVAGTVWLYLAREHFAVRARQVVPALRQSWALGKWLFASQLTLSVQGYFIHWLLAGVAGTEATGIYAACMTVVLFANPLILGISNALAPRTAHAYSAGGRAALRRVVFQTTLILGAIMTVFCVAALFIGDDVMTLLYHGSQYEGYGHTVAVLAFATLVSALGMPASNALAAVERPRLIFSSGLVAVGLTVVVVPFLVAYWGVAGAAYGFLAGNLAGAVGRWIALATVVLSKDSHGDAANVTRVLRTLARGMSEDSWIIEPLDEGAQASLYAVRTREGQPIHPGNPELVVKLYKPGIEQQPGTVRDQFEAMARLHARLDGGTNDGWSIHAPVPLYHSDEPPALVMTRVPGISLNACLEPAYRMTAGAMQSVADAIVVVMHRYWTRDAQIHGDFNFDNILCDVERRRMSFVDPGAGNDPSPWNDAIALASPAARDLAHLLYETEVGVKRTIGNPGARRRQRELAERVLRTFLTSVGPTEQSNLLNELRSCAHAYLQSLGASWTPRGLWRALIRGIATRRINEVLGRLAVDLPNGGVRV